MSFLSGIPFIGKKLDEYSGDVGNFFGGLEHGIAQGVQGMTQADPTFQAPPVAPAPTPPPMSQVQNAANIGASFGLGPNSAAPAPSPHAAHVTPLFRPPTSGNPYAPNTPFQKPDFAAGGSSQQEGGVQGFLQGVGQIPVLGIPVQLGNAANDVATATANNPNGMSAGELATRAAATGVANSPLGMGAQLFGGLANEFTKQAGVGDGTNDNPVFGQTSAFSNQVADKGLGSTLLDNAMNVLGAGGVEGAMGKGRAIDTGKLTAPLQNEAGYISAANRDVGGKFTHDPKNMHPDDQGTIADYIDHISGKKVGDSQGVIRDMEAIADHYGLQLPKGPAAQKSMLNGLLDDQKKSIFNPLKDERGFIGVPGGKGEPPKPPEKPGVTTPGEQPKFDATKYAADQAKAAENAGKSPKGNVVGRAKDAFRKTMVDAFAPVEDKVNKATGGFYSPESTNLRDKIDRSLRSDSIGGQYLKDNGLDKVIQGKTADGKAIPGFSRKELDQYLIAKHAADLEANGVKTGRDLGKDSQYVEAMKEKYQPQADAVTKYNHGLLDKSVESGLISKENADFLKKKYPNYVPMERIFTEDERDIAKGKGGNGTAPASLSKQTIMRKIEGSKREIASPLQSITNKTHDVITQGLRSDAARAVVDTKDIQGNPLGVKPLRTEENVVTRQNAWKKLAELKPVRDQLDKLVKTTTKNIKVAEQAHAKHGQKTLDRIMGKEQTVRAGAVKDANGGRQLPGRSKKPAVAPTEENWRNAFTKYVEGDPSVAKNLEKFMGDKQKIQGMYEQLDHYKNAYDKAMSDRAAAYDEAKLARDADARGKATIGTYKNGVKEIYEVNKEVADAAKSLSKEQIGFIGQLFRVPTRILRLGATSLNPAFAAANVAKDAYSAFINSSHALKSSIANPPVFLQALKASIVHGSKEHGELVREGAGGTSFDIARGDANNSVAAIASHKNLLTRGAYVITHPSELFRAAEDLIGRSEEFTRAMQYYGNKQAALKTMDEGAAKTYAADAARNNTVNFSRAGTLGHVLNSALPYLNAGFQGSRTLLRNLKERPLETGTKIAVTVLFPVAVTTAWNLSDPERKRAYDNITETEKQNNIIIVPEHPKQDDSGRWNVIKIPMSQEIANLGSSVRSGVEAMHGDKNFDFNQLAGNLFGTATSINAQNGISGIADQAVPQGGKLLVEPTTNTNLYTGQKIVPDAMKNLPADQQVNKNTSGTARVLGKVTGLSPMQIDNSIHTATGGLGQNLVHESDKALAAAGVIPKDQVKGKSFIDAMANRFSSAQGQTEGSQFYSTVQKQSANLKLSGSDYNGLQTILSKNFDGDGKPIPSTEKSALERNGILSASPNAALVISNTAKDLAKAQGKPLDPLYNLSPEQQNTYYKLQSTPYQGPEYDRIASTNASWLKPFEQDRSKFFADNPIQNQTPTDRVPYPTFDGRTQQLMTRASQISAIDPTQRTAAQTSLLHTIYSQPNVSAAFASIDKYTNDRRQAQGFDPLKTMPQASPEVQALLDAKNYKDPRSAKYLQDVAEFNIAKGGAADIFKGATPSQSELSGIYSMGNFDISRTKMSDGSNQYALAGQPGYSSGNTSAGYKTAHKSSGGSSSGSRSAMRNVKYNMKKGAKIGMSKSKGLSSGIKKGGGKVGFARGGASAKAKVTIKQSLV